MARIFLAQGTLYPDVIEFGPFIGAIGHDQIPPCLGGLPERMNMQLVEPLRELFFKDKSGIGA